METAIMDRCDLCNARDLVPVYAVPGTARGLSVHVCRQCGLAQSLPRIDHVKRNSPFPDSGAGFGNIRYGKGFRTDFAIETIAWHRPLAGFRSCLDVGANRGSFLRAFLDKAPSATAVAVEPDERVIADYKDHPRIGLINDRVENIDLGENRFDLVYHCHTLEHQARPLQSLKAVARSMTPDGLLFLEVPNIAFLAGLDLVEEWFIDKHLYHYSTRTLCRTVCEAGLDIIQQPDPDDTTNITVIARPKSGGADIAPTDEFETASALISTYGKRLIANQEKLKKGAARLADYCHGRKVAIWGAGRIYTSLVDAGGFNPGLLAGVVDKNLHKYVSEMYGVPVLKPEALMDIGPDVVLVASRLYFDEIRKELSALLPDAGVLTLDDILNGTIGGTHD